MDAVAIALLFVLIAIVLELWRSRRAKWASARLPPPLEEGYSEIWGHAALFTKEAVRGGRLIPELERLAKQSCSPIVTLWPGPPLLVSPLFLVQGSKEGRVLAVDGDMTDALIGSVYLLANTERRMLPRPPAHEAAWVKLLAMSMFRPSKLASLDRIVMQVANSELFLEDYARKCMSSADQSCVEGSSTRRLGKVVLAIMVKYMAAMDFTKNDGTYDDPGLETLFELSSDLVNGFRASMSSGTSPAWFPYVWPSAYRKLRRACNKINTGYFVPAIERRREEIENGDAVPDDPLTSLLTGRVGKSEGDGNDGDGNDGNGGNGGTATLGSHPVQHTDSISMSFTTILLASETAANIMEWLLLCLAANPDVQEKCYDSIATVIGSEPDPDRPSYADLGKFSYWNAFVKEVLRVHMPARVLMRCVRKRTDLGDYTLPAGSDALILQMSSHLSEDTFADPVTVDPERWLRDPSGGASCGRDELTYAPFGYGPHMCCGRIVGITMVRSLGARLLHGYRMELVSRHEEARPVVHGITHHPEKMVLRFISRNAQKA